MSRYWFGIPVRTLAAGAQVADFTEELSGLGDGGALMMREDGFDYHAGPDIISGMGPRGEFRPRRYVFEIDMGTSDVADHHQLTHVVVDHNGTMVTLTFGDIAQTASDVAVVSNRTQHLPACLCPGTATGLTVAHGVAPVVDNVTAAIGTVTITAGGDITIANGAGAAATFAGGAVAVHVLPFSMTYDTAKPW